MQYDSQWTPQERARVEALRLLRQGGGRNLDAAQLVVEMDVLAKAIAGPEAENPFPWDIALEARKDLWDLFMEGRRAAGVRDPHMWTVPTEGDTVMLDACRLHAGLHKLPDHLPF